MPEEWRPVEHWPDYEVSNLGHVRSWKTGRPRLLKTPPDHSGHLRLALSKAGVRRDFSVHRLVAAAFIGPCPEGLEVRHLDGVHENNNVENLKYDTHRQNMRDIAIHGRHRHAARTHCPAGHAYDEANTLRNKSRPNARHCRACRNARNRDYYHRTK